MPVRQLPLDSTARNVTFSPNGRYLGVTTEKAQVWVWDARTWREPAVLQPREQQIPPLVRFSPDSGCLAVAVTGRGYFYQESDWTKREGVPAAWLPLAPPSAPPGKLSPAGDDREVSRVPCVLQYAPDG